MSFPANQRANEAIAHALTGGKKGRPHNYNTSGIETVPMTVVYNSDVDLTAYPNATGGFVIIADTSVSDPDMAYTVCTYPKTLSSNANNASPTTSTANILGSFFSPSGPVAGITSYSNSLGISTDPMTMGPFPLALSNGSGYNVSTQLLATFDRGRTENSRLEIRPTLYESGSTDIRGTFAAAILTTRPSPSFLNKSSLLGSSDPTDGDNIETTSRDTIVYLGVGKDTIAYFGNQSSRNRSQLQSFRKTRSLGTAAGAGWGPSPVPMALISYQDIGAYYYQDTLDFNVIFTYACAGAPTAKSMQIFVNSLWGYIDDTGALGVWSQTDGMTQLDVIATAGSAGAHDFTATCSGTSVNPRNQRTNGNQPQYPMFYIGHYFNMRDILGDSSPDSMITTMTVTTYNSDPETDQFSMFALSKDYIGPLSITRTVNYQCVPNSDNAALFQASMEEPLNEDDMDYIKTMLRLHRGSSLGLLMGFGEYEMLVNKNPADLLTPPSWNAPRKTMIGTARLEATRGKFNKFLKDLGGAANQMHRASETYQNFANPYHSSAAAEFNASRTTRNRFLASRAIPASDTLDSPEENGAEEFEPISSLSEGEPLGPPPSPQDFRPKTPARVVKKLLKNKLNIPNEGWSSHPSISEINPRLVRMAEFFCSSKLTNNSSLIVKACNMLSFLLKSNPKAASCIQSLSNFDSMYNHHKKIVNKFNLISSLIFDGLFMTGELSASKCQSLYMTCYSIINKVSSAKYNKTDVDNHTNFQACALQGKIQSMFDSLDEPLREYVASLKPDPHSINSKEELRAALSRKNKEAVVTMYLLASHFGEKPIQCHSLLEFNPEVFPFFHRLHSSLVSNVTLDTSGSSPKPDPLVPWESVTEAVKDLTESSTFLEFVSKVASHALGSTHTPDEFTRTFNYLEHALKCDFDYVDSILRSKNIRLLSSRGESSSSLGNAMFAHFQCRRHPLSIQGELMRELRTNPTLNKVLNDYMVRTDESADPIGAKSTFAQHGLSTHRTSASAADLFDTILGDDDLISDDLDTSDAEFQEDFSTPISDGPYELASYKPLDHRSIDQATELMLREAAGSHSVDTTKPIRVQDSGMMGIDKKFYLGPVPYQSVFSAKLAANSGMAIFTATNGANFPLVEKRDDGPPIVHICTVVTSPTGYSTSVYKVHKEDDSRITLHLSDLAAHVIGDNVVGDMRDALTILSLIARRANQSGLNMYIDYVSPTSFMPAGSISGPSFILAAISSLLGAPLGPVITGTVDGFGKVAPVGDIGDKINAISQAGYLSDVMIIPSQIPPNSSRPLQSLIEEAAAMTRVGSPKIVSTGTDTLRLFAVSSVSEMIGLMSMGVTIPTATSFNKQLSQLNEQDSLSQTTTHTIVSKLPHIIERAKAKDSWAIDLFKAIRRVAKENQSLQIVKDVIRSYGLNDKSNETAKGLGFGLTLVPSGEKAYGIAPAPAAKQTKQAPDFDVTPYNEAKSARSDAFKLVNENKAAFISKDDKPLTMSQALSIAKDMGVDFGNKKQAQLSTGSTFLKGSVKTVKVMSNPEAGVKPSVLTVSIFIPNTVKPTALTKKSKVIQIDEDIF